MMKRRLLLKNAKAGVQKTYPTIQYNTLHTDYVIESALYGFLFTSCKALENERVSVEFNIPLKSV